MILSCAAMKALEERAFAEGVHAADLMEEAGSRIALAVMEFCPQPSLCVAVFGKGHNGGDVLVAARYLAEQGWDVLLVAAFDSWAPLVSQHYSAALDVGCTRDDDALSHPADVVLDGLLGLGGSGALRGPVQKLTQMINAHRRQYYSQVFAIDLPTGLDGDSGEPANDCVIADATLAIGFAKQGHVAEAAINHVGRLAILPLKELSARMDSSEPAQILATPGTLRELLPPRKFDTHKGACGRVGIVAGSPGMYGAAVLCATACVHGGAGLITLYALPEIASQLALLTPPEVMVQPVHSLKEVMDRRHDVLAIGPGLGADHAEEIVALIRDLPQPVVVDADALNAMAGRMEVLRDAKGPRLLTPHPGEMARLDPASTTRSRVDTIHTFCKMFPGTTLLLKGARTLIGEQGKPLSINSTGTPGMATGGMGDVLAGVLAALIGQKLTAYDAARLGAWLCGRAAELAISHGGESVETLTPSRLIDHLGMAFRALRSGIA